MRRALNLRTRVAAPPLVMPLLTTTIVTTFLLRMMPPNSPRESSRTLRKGSASSDLIKRNSRPRCARTGRCTVPASGWTNALLPMALTSSAKRSTCLVISNLRSASSTTKQKSDSVPTVIVASSCTLNTTSYSMMLNNFLTPFNSWKTHAFLSSVSNRLSFLTSSSMSMCFRMSTNNNPRD